MLTRIGEYRYCDGVNAFGEFPAPNFILWTSEESGMTEESPQLEVWTTPDFVEYETPMEVTSYAGREQD